MAVGNCEQLLQEMQYVISILDVDVNKYLPYVDMIEKEIALLRAWRKSDNRLLERVKQNEAKRLGSSKHTDDPNETKDSDRKQQTNQEKLATPSKYIPEDDPVGVKVEEQGTIVDCISRVSTGPEEQKASKQITPQSSNWCPEETNSGQF